jgi:hypothetical protein
VTKVNCSQARAWLAEYREVKQAPHHLDGANEHLDQTLQLELEAHLASCAACRDTLAQHEQIGQQLRALPVIEPAPGAHARLMQALAAEHARFLQNATTPPPPTPTFLLPYLKEQPRTDTLTALSTADTGPIPVIRALPKHRKRASMNQLAIVGLAAAFLMVLMTGGLTTLLLMARQGIPTGAPLQNVSIQNPNRVAQANYSAASIYPYVTSAVATREAIYYTARGTGSTGWMLQRFDLNNRTITPLLKQDSQSPLVVVASNQDWLIWLEQNNSKVTSKEQTVDPDIIQPYSWNLNALPLTLGLPNSKATPITLLHGTFDGNAVSGWVQRPVQGTWLAQNTLLIASIDDKGYSQLLEYRLDAKKAFNPRQIAQAPAGHVFTSPTANTSGSQIFWAEVWQENDQVSLHSNIWTQQSTLIAPSYAGKWAPHATSQVSILRKDGMSFRPQVVNETLYFLNASSAATTSAQTSATATVHSASSVTPRVDIALRPVQKDSLVQGILMSYTVTGTQPVVKDDADVQVNVQGGSRFLLWENGNKGFEMYDTIAHILISVSNDIPRDALFLTVNGDSVVWVGQDALDKMTAATPEVSFTLFNWPTAAA